MTNSEIILMNRALLVADGKITEADVIHTFAHWQRLGFNVKRGQKAIAKFPIWKYRAGKKTDEAAEGEPDPGRMFMTNASFFSSAQVEAQAQ